MLYSIVSTIFFSLIFIGGILIILNSKFHAKKFLYVIVFVVAFVAVIKVSSLPLEDSFLNFPTPESVYEYETNNKRGNVIFKSYGKNSCMMFTDRNDFRFAKKQDGEWKIAPNCSTWSVYNTVINGNTVNSKKIPAKSITVYKVGKTEDYYVRVVSFGTEKINISDSNESEFNLYEENNAITYVGYVYAMNKNYLLTVDDKMFNLGSKIDS